MLSFENDYNVGTHPEILKRLAETNLDPQSGYGADIYCERAKECIRRACGCNDADVFFMVGGTQTNAVVIDALLKPYEGVVAARTGHISLHEAGAIEYTGHKVMELPEVDGKLQPDALEKLFAAFYSDENRTHMVRPGMVYLSQPTELGTLYSRGELEQISDLCRQYGAKLYVDGARLGYGLTSREADFTLEDLSRLCDVFYIGGTKVGALCGEAVVFPNGDMPDAFLTIVKQHGALLAKGRLLGVSFETLFTNNLYYDISKNAIERAEELKELFHRKGFRIWRETPTNQQFIILSDEEMNRLKENVTFSFWEKFDENHTVVRFVTGWATTKSQIEELEQLLDKI